MDARELEAEQIPYRLADEEKPLIPRAFLSRGDRI
jgi:hypothetical protein